MCGTHVMDLQVLTDNLRDIHSKHLEIQTQIWSKTQKCLRLVSYREKWEEMREMRERHKSGVEGMGLSSEKE